MACPVCSYRQLQVENDSRVSELTSEVKLKRFELERLQLVQEETRRNLNHCEVEKAKQGKKIEVCHTVTHVTLSYMSHFHTCHTSHCHMYNGMHMCVCACILTHTHTHTCTDTNLCTHFCRSSQTSSTTCAQTQRRRLLSWRQGRRSWQHDWRCTRNWRRSWTMWSCRRQRVGACTTQGMCCMVHRLCTCIHMTCMVPCEYIHTSTVQCLVYQFSYDKHCTYSI